MIICNITLKPDTDIQGQWLEWTREIYIPGILATGLFRDFHLCRLLEQDDRDGPTYSIQLFCDSMEHYHRYKQGHAGAFDQQLLQRFGNKVVLFRTVMQLIS